MLENKQGEAEVDVRTVQNPAQEGLKLEPDYFSLPYIFKHHACCELDPSVTLTHTFENIADSRKYNHLKNYQLTVKHVSEKKILMNMVPGTCFFKMKPSGKPNLTLKAIGTRRNVCHKELAVHDCWMLPKVVSTFKNTGPVALIITHEHKYEITSERSSPCLVLGVFSRPPDFKVNKQAKFLFPPSRTLFLFTTTTI